jgi:hypothetical protein
LPNCFGLFVYNATQTGIVVGDTFHVDPYQPATVSSTLPATFPVSLGIGNSGNVNVCSPGAYSEYVTGTDGAASNTHYVPILDRWNTWAGHDATDEYQADYAGKATHKYKLTDGTQDGADLPLAGMVNIIDGPNFIGSNLGNGGIVVYVAATGTPFNGNNRSGDNIVGVAAKNGIIGYTTNQEVSFFLESTNQNIADVSSVGTGPAGIAMSAGCSSDPNTATAFVYDEAGSTLYRADAVGTPVDQNGNATVSASKVGGGVYLSGLSPASAAPKTLARYVVAWDNTCKAVVLAPVVTGTNPDGSPAYNVEFALLDMTAGNMRQLGTYVFSTTVNNITTTIPSTAIRVAADPAGSDVIVASSNESTGTTILTKVSWTLNANGDPLDSQGKSTFVVATLNSTPPAGVYGVSLGVLPNGKISVGQRQQHFVLAAQ